MTWRVSGTGGQTDHRSVEQRSAVPLGYPPVTNVVANHRVCGANSLVEALELAGLIGVFVDPARIAEVAAAGEPFAEIDRRAMAGELSWPEPPREIPSGG